ncbi:hypothetical protein CLV58_14415 [Spirosoma oryzae]|uniref:PD-(D/E)XK nuclease superfamily protein n=1 Tax=Spirosoma oryzae TaxID=1469603 RepID=A0A2T0RNG7_9BACT|nr:hypothetical protein [Spirosoma oryzae]PRY22735.1 hypothetical protein CLV58_14415 [Spirosoma oryzae]
MSKLHYFQRYSSKENWVTNATLLFLSRLYHYDRLKFETTLNLILDNSNLSLEIGVKFTQQQWGKNSVVDGVISQDSFKVVVETKLYDNFSTDQLIRHFDSFGNDHSSKILLTLSKNTVNNDIKAKILQILQIEKYKDIKFASTTYESIYKTVSSVLSDNDLEMKDILEDYILLCTEQGLTNIDRKTLLAFTATDSWSENLKYDIYYDPANRRHNSPFKYVGLYLNKKVIAVGALKKIVVCNYVEGKLVAPAEGGLNNIDDNEYSRIKGIIEDTTYYDLKNGSKFFLVDKFYPTNFVKTSFSSVRAKRYFWLDQIKGFKDGMTAEQIAQLLNGETFE